MGAIFEDKNVVKLKVSLKFEKIIKRLKRGENEVNVFTFDRITSQIREFLAIRNLEFDFLNKYIMMPKLIVSECLQKHNDDIFIDFFKSIEPYYNESQLESIRNICLTKQGIKLLQGPVIFLC